MAADDLEPLPKELRRLLESEQGAPGAPEALKARLFSRLSGELFSAAAVGVGLGASAADAATSTASSHAAAWGTAAVTKLAVGVGLTAFTVGGFVGAGVHAVTSPRPTPPPAVASSPPQIPAEPVVEPPSLPAPLPPPEPVKNSRPVKPVEKPAADRLGEERSYLEQARSAMARRDSAAALSALGEHERRFPSGQLVEERMALQILALAGEGRTDEAKQLAARFRAKYPSSLLRQAIDAAVP